MSVRLLPATEARFDWLMGGAAVDGLRLPPGGVDDADTLGMLRRAARKTRAAGVEGSFLVVSGTEVVGLCGLKGLPDAEGCAEIGYGIAPARRRRGHATAAVGALLAVVPRLGVRRVLAVTGPRNAASERVLAMNGFEGGPPGSALGGARAWRRMV